MKHIKRVITIFLIFLIMAASLVPSLRCSHFVFADNSIEWTNINSNEELRDAWLYYLKSRNILVDGSVIDAVNKWTINQMVNLANSLGLNIGQIMNNIKKSDNKYLYDQDAIQFMNGLTQGLLDEYNFDVGDVIDDEIVYSGSVFTDQDGNNCLVFICNINTSSVSNTAINTSFTHGTPYKYNYNDVRTLVGTGSFSPSFHVTAETNFNPTWRWFDRGGTDQYITNSTTYNSGMRLYARDVNGVTIKGYPAIIYNAFNNTYYVGYFSNADHYNGSSYVGNTHSVLYMQKPLVMNNNAQNVNVYITTNNNTVNNNNYVNNTYTVINNDGDVYNYDGNEEPPVNPPESDPVTPSDWGVDLPDLNIDWLLTGKENKFPFNIPFNILLTLSLLNAEPEAPHFEGTVDLGVYQWTYDIDLEQFDPVAEVCRNFEFIAFLIGLMLLTKRLIWG